MQLHAVTLLLACVGSSAAPPLNIDCDLHLKYGLSHHTIPVSPLHNHVCGAIICSYADPEVSLISLHRSVCLCACTCMCAGVCRGHIGSYFTQTPLCLQHTAGTALPDIPPTTCVCVCVCVGMSVCFCARACRHLSTAHAPVHSLKHMR